MFARLLEEFDSPAARARAPALEGWRRRKLISFLLVLLVVCLVSSIMQVVLGLTLAAVGTFFITGVLTGSLVALRRGAPAWLITCVVLFFGITAAGLMAMTTAEHGVNSLIWIVLAPLVALPIGGRRAGWITLALSAVAMGVCLVGIERGWLSTLMTIERPAGAQLVSLLGVLLAGFLLTRAYEVQTQANIIELQAQNRALLEAQAEAGRASRAKSEFLATISHEIRTPLNGVTGLVTLLREESDPTRLREGLRIIQQSSDTLLAVISDVLDFSKIESSQLELEKVPLSVERELRVVVDLLQSSAAEGGVELELTLDPEVPAWILGDPTRLRQVILNLVSNAVKFTSEGRVTVRGRMVEGWLHLEVSDTGIGMSKEVRQRLFEPFVQADASTTRCFGGTGLGLVISRRLVRGMGGDITVLSVPGEGSRFTVSMPIILTGAPAAVAEVMPAVSAPRRVLVVEDNRVNQVVVMRLLQKLGHAVTVAGDGVQALRLVAHRQFDLVLMDCHMPVMDGYEATRQLRARGDHTPVFALTAAVTNEDRELCREAGMNGVLSKPLRVERLCELVNSMPPTMHLLPSTAS